MANSGEKENGSGGFRLGVALLAVCVLASIVQFIKTQAQQAYHSHPHEVVCSTGAIATTLLVIVGSLSWNKRQLRRAKEAITEEDAESVCLGKELESYD